MTQLQRILCYLSPSVLLLACSSSGASAESRGLLVILHDYKTGQELELASEAHTDRVAYYSSTRANAARKVQTDEVMSAFVEQLEQHGFDEHDQIGRAPTITSGKSEVIRWGLEVERGSARSHWLIGTASPADDWKAFQECRDTFLQLYNITVSFQAVQNDSGGAFFGGGAAQAGTGKKR